MAKTDAVATQDTTDLTGVRKSDLTFDELVQAGNSSADVFDVISVVDKEKLIGVPLAIVGMQFSESPTGGYVTVMAKLQDGTDLLFSDGGTGIYAQCNTAAEKGKLRFPVICLNGLRVSRYVHPEVGPSETFYLS